MHLFQVQVLALQYSPILLRLLNKAIIHILDFFFHRCSIFPWHVFLEQVSLHYENKPNKILSYIHIQLVLVLWLVLPHI